MTLSDSETEQDEQPVVLCELCYRLYGWTGECEWEEDDPDDAS